MVESTAPGHATAARRLSVRFGRAVGLVLVSLVFCSSGAVLAAETSPVTIAWDPPQDPTVVGYVVVVGTGAGSYSQQFDVGNATTFDYSSGEAGHRYFFAVKSYNAASVLSEPSSEVSAVIGELAAGGAPGDDANQDATSPHPRRWPAPGEPVADAAATDGGSANAVPRRKVVTALSHAGDDAVLFIEAGRTIRAFVGGLAASQPLLVADGGVELTGVVADPEFAKTHVVFVGEAEALPDGTREFTIARYRAVNETLGERAVIITGVSLPDVGDASFDVDGAGHLYLAVPAARDQSAERRDPYAARLLRFNVDGTVPRDNRAGSPIVAYGYAQPTAVKVDGVGRVWLAGGGGPLPEPVAVLDSNVTAQWPAVPQGVPASSIIAAAGVIALDVVSSAKQGDPAMLVFLSGDNRLASMYLTPSGFSAPVSWGLTGHGAGTAVLATGTNSVLVTFASASGDTRISEQAGIALFRLP